MRKLILLLSIVISQVGFAQDDKVGASLLELIEQETVLKGTDGGNGPDQFGNAIPLELDRAVTEESLFGALNSCYKEQFADLLTFVEGGDWNQDVMGCETVSYKERTEPKDLDRDISEKERKTNTFCRYKRDLGGDDLFESQPTAGPKRVRADSYGRRNSIANATQNEILLGSHLNRGTYLYIAKGEYNKGNVKLENRLSYGLRNSYYKMPIIVYRTAYPNRTIDEFGQRVWGEKIVKTASVHFPTQYNSYTELEVDFRIPGADVIYKEKRDKLLSKVMYGSEYGGGGLLGYSFEVNQFRGCMDRELSK